MCNDIENIKTKIQKLLALASSPNEHEAQRAMEMANALLLKYNLDMSELPEAKDDREIVEETFELGTSAFQWKIQLAVAIARHNFCEVLLGYRNRRLYFIGRRCNVDATRDIYTWVTMQLLSICREERKRVNPVEWDGRPMDGLRWQTSFCMGAVVRINHRLIEQRRTQERETTGCTAMVLCNKQAIDAFLSENYPRLTKKSNNAARMDAAAYNAGKAAGDKVQLQRQSQMRQSSTVMLSA